MIDLNFNARRFIYSVSACVRNVYDSMTFVNGKLNFRSHQFVLSASALDRRNLLDNEMYRYINIQHMLRAAWVLWGNTV